jgi:hypothetical protein
LVGGLHCSACFESENDHHFIRSWFEVFQIIIRQQLQYFQTVRFDIKLIWNRICILAIVAGFRAVLKFSIFFWLVSCPIFVAFPALPSAYAAFLYVVAMTGNTGRNLSWFAVSISFSRGTVAISSVVTRAARS